MAFTHVWPVGQVVVQVPFTQHCPAAQQAGVPWKPQIRLVGQQTPPTQALPAAQHTSLAPVPQTVVPLGAHTPLHTTWPAGQAQVQPVAGLGTCPGMVQLTQVGVVEPLGVQAVLPLGQAQAQVAALSTCPAGQGATQVSLHSIVPALHSHWQVLALSVWPLGQAGTQAPPLAAPLQKVVPVGQTQLPV